MQFMVLAYDAKDEKAIERRLENRTKHLEAAKVRKDNNELLNEAIKETANLKEEEIFLVKELFKGYEWNRIPRSERILLGTLFLHHINKGTTSIKAIQKTTSGQQKYQITKSKGV